MLDTNIVSNALRFPYGLAATKMTEEGAPPVCMSVIVAAELRFGAVRVGSERLSQQIEGVIHTIDVLPLTEPVSARYAALRTHLERAGTPIGPNDLLIAAHALALDLTLVTDNLREFSRVPDLRVENWLD